MAAGLQQVAANVALEGLLAFGKDGKPQAWLANKWSRSPDGLELSVTLKPSVAFHNGQPVTAEVVRDILREALPRYIGSAASDIDRIEASGDREVQILLKRPSNFVLEGLDVLLQFPNESSVGTGPFAVASITGDTADMRANSNYHGGRPLLDRLQIRAYPTVRAAWADLLRGDVDMLYEVGPDALASLRPSTLVRVFTHQRSYALVVLFNVQKPVLKDPAVRRRLSEAVNRKQIVDTALNSHARPAESIVWPDHWANDHAGPSLVYHPQAIESGDGASTFTLLYTEPTHERLALLVQQQLQAIGVNVNLKQVRLDDALRLVEAGQFDAWLADVVQGPPLLRASWFWHSKGRFNWGGYTDAAVDAALDKARQATTDDEYKAAVKDYERAMVIDPPAIFLAWSERARAVSTRFEVPVVEPGRDILSTLRLWRPVAGPRSAELN